MEVCLLSHEVMLQPLSVPITGPAFAFSIFLLPAFHKVPLRFPSDYSEKYGAYHVPLIQQYGLGFASPPTALCPCIPTVQGDSQLRYHFGSGLSATLACSALTTFISDSHYINHTIQVRLPDRIVACSLLLSPCGFCLNPFGWGYPCPVTLPHSRYQLLC